MNIFLDSLPVKLAAEGGYRLRYEPLAPMERRYDKTLLSAVTTVRGYSRVWEMQTEFELAADIDALDDILTDQVGRITLSGDIVASPIEVHVLDDVTRVIPENADLAALRFQIREAGTIVGGDRQELVRVWLADATDTLIDRTEWFINASISSNREQFAKTAEVTFWREKPGSGGVVESIAPLMTSPRELWANRRIEVEVAIIGLNDTLLESDWETIFEGRTDDIGWGGADSKVTMPCRDKAGQIHDAQLENEKEYGDNVIPPEISTVMQELIDDSTLGPGIFTLFTIGDPDVGILRYLQKRTSLESGLFKLRDIPGWDLRMLPNDGTGQEELTFYEPPRNQTTPNLFFTEDDYLTISDVAISSENVRNKIEVDWSTTEGSVTAIDEDSVADFGLKYMRLDETKNEQINTLAKAQAYAELVLLETAQPPLTHTAENVLTPEVQIGLLCEYAANDVHYDAAQRVAIVGFTHNLTPEGNTTSIQARGQPSGSVTRWLRKGKKTQEDEETEDVLDPPSEDLAPGDTLWVYTTNASGVFGGYSAESSEPESLGGWFSSTPIPNGLNSVFREVEEIDIISGGVTFYKAVALLNTNASPVPQDYECVMVYLPDTGISGSILWSIAKDPAGIVPITDSLIQGFTTPDELTEPSDSPSLNWVSPTEIDHPDALDVGTIPSGYGVMIWIRLQVFFGAVGHITDEFLVARDRRPQETA